MKNSILVLFAFLISAASIAQNGINYKALVKDSNGDVLVTQSVTVQFQILEGGTTNVYQETHTATTDTSGIIAINIGEGTVDSGNFVAIDWGSDDYFLNVQVDTGGGLVDLGSTQFKSVPYAKVAETVKKLPITNLKFPNGFEGMEAVTATLSPSANYTVPAGKNFYITNVRSISALVVTRNTIEHRLTSGWYNSADVNASTVGNTERTLTNPFIFKENDIFEALGTTFINGFLIDAGDVDSLLVNLLTNYTVPSNKTLVILNYHSFSTATPLLINGQSVYAGYNNGFVSNSISVNRLFNHSFEMPLFANEGDVISTPSGIPGNINGYLLDKN